MGAGTQSKAKETTSRAHRNASRGLDFNEFYVLHVFLREIGIGYRNFP